MYINSYSVDMFFEDSVRYFMTEDIKRPRKQFSDSSEIEEIYLNGFSREYYAT